MSFVEAEVATLCEPCGAIIEYPGDTTSTEVRRLDICQIKLREPPDELYSPSEALQIRIARPRAFSDSCAAQVSFERQIYCHMEHNRFAHSQRSISGHKLLT